MQTKTMFFIGVLLFCVAIVRAPFLGPYQYNGCVDINSSGQFALGSDLVGANITPTHISTTACIVISEPDVELDCYDHTITNNVAGDTTGILLDSRNSSQLTNVTIKNCRVSNYTLGIYTYNSNYGLLLNNTVNLSTSYGFEVDNSSYIDLTNNTAYNDSVGFYTYNSYNNTFNNDTAANNTWGFILLGDSSGNNLTSSTAYGSFWHGFLVQSISNSNLLVNNTAYSNSYEGFYVAGSNFTTLINNTAHDNHEDGFLVGNSSSYNVLTNNTAYNNIIDGFEIGYSTYNTLDNNTAYNNTRSGFALYYTDYNNLTNNHYNQPSYQQGYFRYDAFDVYNSSYNNFVNNTALNGYEAGFSLYGSNYNSFINNTARNNSWEGFAISSSFNNSFIDNLAYGSQQYGFEIFISSGNNLTNNTAQENEMFDFYTDALSWNFFLNATLASNEFCNNRIQNLTGSGGRPINYSNTSVNWDSITASEIVLCNADGSNITNSIVHGSDIIRNNGIILTSTDGAVMDNVNSSSNFVGFAALLSNSNNFTNNIAEDDLLAGFANFIGVGNRFANNMQSGSMQGGFLELLSNDSAYINNTAHGNYMAGFAILEGSNHTHLINNTVHHTSEVGVIVEGSDFTMITGDHYYDNDVDFAVNNTGYFFPSALSRPQYALDNVMNSLQEHFTVLPTESNTLNLSGVIFDNPLGNYEYYTNMSLNDVVPITESYAITWSTKPAVGDPPFELSFHVKFINIQATPGAVINNMVWHWTDDEAAGRSEDSLKVFLHKNLGWQNSPGQSILDTVNNQLSIDNVNEFGVFGLFEIATPQRLGGGGGESCSDTLKISLVRTICPGNKALLQVAKSDGTPVGAGDMVTLAVDTQKYVEHTDSNGQVTFTLPRSSSYGVHAISGFYCGDYTLDYTLCSAVSTGCPSDADCADAQYCDSSGACMPVGCPCGQSYAHSCHPYVCCADSDCNSSYACVDHQCKLVTTPECTTNADCKYNEYCGDGKCLPVQIGQCGRISDHAWKDYDCCNDSDCQNHTVCKDHTCVRVYTITTNPTGPVGESHQVKVLPEGKYTLNVVTPNGGSKTIETDQNGNAVFVLENSGTYTVYLLKDEATKASVAVNAINNTPPAGKPAASVQQDYTYIILIAILLILVIAIIIYLLTRKGRRRY